MGMDKRKHTHGQRSSVMTSAWGWLKKRWRKILLFSLVPLFIVVDMVIVMGQSGLKEVTIIIDGKNEQVKTRSNIVQKVLDEQNITLQNHDNISMKPYSKLHDGDKIIIDHAQAVILTMNGKIKTHYTSGKTVHEALIQLGYKLNTADRVTPDRQNQVFAGMKIKVVCVTKKVEEQKHKLPFETIKEVDATLKTGTTQVIREGKPGVIIKKFEKTYEDGKLVSEVLIAKQVSVEKVDKIISVGLKEAKEQSVTVPVNPGKVTKNGVTFNYSNVINNTTLTAYSQHDEGVGTRTASGTRVTEGRTIAVDRKIIPIGWWVYIDKIGFRRAEDTGGAIKGNKIDVYIDDVTEAEQFGRKKGYTVYVIGPNKPEVNSKNQW